MSVKASFLASERPIIADRSNCSGLPPSGFAQLSMEEYEVEERKQAAADALMHYSQFAMVCIGKGVSPSKLRLHLLKELSGMPTTLKKEIPQQGSSSSESNATTADRADRASSSSGTSVAAAAEMQVDRARNQDRGV